MKTIKVVNAAYSFAFEVYTPIPDGVEEDDFEDQLELNGKTLREALLQRLNKLSDEELAAACDAPWDSCIDEVDESKVNEAAEEDTEAFDRSFPELSNAAAGLMALKAMQDADFGSKIADMIIGPLEK